MVRTKNMHGIFQFNAFQYMFSFQSSKSLCKHNRNIFIKSHTIIPDRSIPSLTYKFAEMLSVFHAHNLRQNLLLHLFNLWDSSLVSSQHILLCMTTYDSTAPRIVHKKTLSPSCRMLEPSPSVGRSKLNSQTSPFRRSKKRILEGK